MRISIGKTLMWSAIRALVQLCVMGVIIGYVIRSNNPWLVFGVIAVMLVAAVQITLSRAKGIPKGLAGPVLLSLVITMLLMISLVTELVVRPHPGMHRSWWCRLPACYWATPCRRSPSA